MPVISFEFSTDMARLERKNVIREGRGERSVYVGYWKSRYSRSFSYIDQVCSEVKETLEESTVLVYSKFNERIVLPDCTASEWLADVMALRLGCRTTDVFSLSHSDLR